MAVAPGGLRADDLCRCCSGWLSSGHAKRSLAWPHPALQALNEQLSKVHDRVDNLVSWVEALPISGEYPALQREWTDLQHKVGCCESRGAGQCARGWRGGLGPAAMSRYHLLC